MSGSSAGVQNEHCHVCVTVNSDGKVSGKLLPKVLPGGFFKTVQFLAGTLEVLLAFTLDGIFVVIPLKNIRWG
jgi:hypothetical protein